MINEKTDSKHKETHRDNQKDIDTAKEGEKEKQKTDNK